MLWPCPSRIRTDVHRAVVGGFHHRHCRVAVVDYEGVVTQEALGERVRCSVESKPSRIPHLCELVCLLVWKIGTWTTQC